MRELIAGLTQLPRKVLVDKKCQVLPPPTKIQPRTLTRGLGCQSPQPTGALLRPVETTRKHPGEKLETARVVSRNWSRTETASSREVEGQVANKPRKKGSTSLVVKETPIATTAVSLLWIK